MTKLKDILNESLILMNEYEGFPEYDIKNADLDLKAGDEVEILRVPSQYIGYKNRILLKTAKVINVLKGKSDAQTKINVNGDMFLFPVSSKYLKIK